MRDEQAFRKIMIQARALAKKQDNCISTEKLKVLFQDMELTEEELLLVCSYLTEEKVTVFPNEEACQESLSKTENENQRLPDKEEASYLSMYLSELSELEAVDKAERLKRIAQILMDKAGAEEIATLYLREVVDIARLYEGQGVTVEDLIGEGNIALLMGVKILECCETAEEVEEFLVKMIMDAMEALIMEQSEDDDLDLQVLERVNDLNEKAKELAESLEREVTLKELAKEFTLDIEELEETFRLSGDAIAYIKHEHEEHD